MKSNVDQRIARTIVGALLQSSITAQDLKKVVLDRELRDQIFAQLELAIELFDGYRSYETKERLQPQEGLIELAYTEIQRKRISKFALNDMIRSIAGGRSFQFNKSATIREILGTFFENASSSDSRRLLEALSSGESIDAYLEGILSRRG